MEFEVSSACRDVDPGGLREGFATSFAILGARFKGMRREFPGLEIADMCRLELWVWRVFRGLSDVSSWVRLGASMTSLVYVRFGKPGFRCRT